MIESNDYDLNEIEINPRPAGGGRICPLLDFLNNSTTRLVPQLKIKIQDPQDPTPLQDFRIQDPLDYTLSQNFRIQDPLDPTQSQNFRILDSLDPMQH